MKKILSSLIVLFLFSTAYSQEVLIKENIQDWTAQSSSGNYTQDIQVKGELKTITLADCSIQPNQSSPGAGASEDCSRGRINCASNKGIITLPVLENIAFVRIHATTGSNDRSFALEQKQTDGSWILLESFTTQNQCGEYTYVLNERNASTLRMRSNTGSSLYIWDIYVEEMPAEGAPVVESLSPANGEENVTINPVFTIVFNKNIQKGSGEIRIVDAVNSTNYQVIAVDDLIINEKEVTFSFAGELDLNTTYYIQIPQTAFKDNYGNYFEGIADNYTWKFKTRSVLSSENDILSIALPGQVDETRFLPDNKIEIDVKYGTSNQLVPTNFLLSDAAVLLDASIDEAINISAPVAFKVQAENGDVKTWTLTVFKLKNTEANITRFDIERGVATIDAAAATIKAIVWGYESLNNLLPEITLSANASSDVNLQVPSDFSSEKMYRITSEDGKTVKEWKVSITILESADAPTLYEGPWQNMSRKGWIGYGLGTDDTKTGSEPNGAANIANKGSFIMLHFSQVPEELKYRFRPTGSAGTVWEGKLEIQVSEAGMYWSTVKTHTNITVPSSTNCAEQPSVTLADTVRYVRFILTEKPSSGGNAIVDGISVSAKQITAKFNPQNNSRGISVNVTPIIQFDAPVKKINGVEFPEGLNNITLVDTETSKPVNANVTINEKKDEVKITPSSILNVATYYQVKINGVVESENGILQSFDVVEFRTEATEGESDKDIVSFNIEGQVGNALINNIDRTVNVQVEEDTDVKNTLPAININGKSWRLVWNYGGDSCPQYYEVEAHDGTIAEWKVIFSFSNDPTGNEVVVDFGEKASLILYPVPVLDYVNFESTAELNRIAIYSIEGSLVRLIEVNSNNSLIDVSDLTSGLYVFSGIQHDGNVVKKLFIKK